MVYMDQPMSPPLLGTVLAFFDMDWFPFLNSYLLFPHVFDILIFKL